MRRTLRRPGFLFVFCLSLILSGGTGRAGSLWEGENGKTSLARPETEALAERPETEAPGEEPWRETPDAAGGTERETSRENPEEIFLDEAWGYAGFSEIHTESATLTHATISPRGITVCVNAGHGTEGGELVKTLCHPDGSPKVTGGSTGEGATYAAAISAGMTFLSGVPERDANLKVSLILKRKLLDAGFDVLMIREGGDVQLDNIARTVIANNQADCHIAIHFDSTETDKGAFYLGVPEDISYRMMEPVASAFERSEAFGQALIQGLSESGVSLFESGRLSMDLTQTSYSTIPSVDIELGDRASDISEESCERYAGGLLLGVEHFFGSDSGAQVQ